MKSRNVRESFGYAVRGIIYTWKTQRNMRIHSFCALGVLVGAWFFKVSKNELLVLILTSFMVIAAEMINTAVETVVDMFTDQYHPLAEISKNVAAGMVLITAISAVIIGIIIFAPKLLY